MPAFVSLRLAAPPSTRDAWNAQRLVLSKAMRQVMGRLPPDASRQRAYRFIAEALGG